MEGNFTRKIVNNNGIEIEYYVSNQVSDKATLIISMGIWEPATRAFSLMARLTGRHCIVLSYRGRGGSSTPESGFDWSHHAADLACVLRNEKINKPVFLGFSKGVSYMLAYLSKNPQVVNGVIIIDYPAIHSKLESGAAQFWGNMIYNGHKLDNYVSNKALEGIEVESTYNEFYDDLKEMHCPIWLFRGVDIKSSIPSNLSDEDVLKYKDAVRNIEIINFRDSGHMILDEELGKAARYINKMLVMIDNEHCSRDI